MGTCSFEKEAKKDKISSQKYLRSHTKPRKSSETMEERHVKEKVNEIFDKYDLDKDGYLNLKEATELMKSSYSKRQKNNMNNSSDFYRHAAEKWITNATIYEEEADDRISK
mgnify:CR=1 FL=1